MLKKEQEFFFLLAFSRDFVVIKIFAFYLNKIL